MNLEDGVIIISNKQIIGCVKEIFVRWKLVFSAGILSSLIAVATLSYKGEEYVYSAILKPSEISLPEPEKTKLLEGKIVILAKLRGDIFADRLSKISESSLRIIAKEVGKDDSLISLSIYSNKKLEVNNLFQNVIQIINQDNLLYIENYKRLLEVELKEINKRVEKREILMAKINDCQSLDSVQMIACVSMADANLRGISSDRILKSKIYWAMDEKNTFANLLLGETVNSKVLKNSYVFVAISFFILGCLVCILIIVVGFLKKYMPNLN